MVNYYLMHHGVKGMKWGVRKAKKKATTSHVQPGEDSTSSVAKQKRTWSKGARMTGRIVTGICQSVSVGMLSAWGQARLVERGNDAAAEIVRFATFPIEGMIAGATIGESINIGRDKRDRW